MTIKKNVQRNKITLTIIIFILIADCFLNASERNNRDVINTFNSIPRKHQEEIKKLFEYLFKYQAFAYSLYGDKPITLSDTVLSECSPTEFFNSLLLDKYCLDIFEIYCEPSDLFKIRWEIWNKYKKQFNIKKYVFLEKVIGKQNRIFLINKKSFKEVINQNIHLFKRIINPNLSAESLLAQFENESKNVFDILHNNEGLLGILLGFGKHNSMLFQKRENLLDKLKKMKTSGIYNVEPFQKKINLLNAKLHSLREHDPYIIASINRVCFTADPEHDETIELRVKYDKLNREINKIYSKDDWFEQTLIQLTSE